MGGWGANGKNMQGGGKGGCPTTNAAERALLEGYRMGRYSQGGKGGHSGGKGGSAQGKGGGKQDYGAGKAAAGAQLEERTCQRIGCVAAIKKQATFGGGCNCFRCGLSMATTLPVEQLVDWAWQKRLDEKAAKAVPAQAQAAAPTTQPSASAKAAGSAPNAQAEAEGSAALRTKRLALLKQAKDQAGQAHASDAAPPPTFTQEIARVYVDTAQPPKKIALDQAAVLKVKNLDSIAAAVLDALQAESMPAEDPLKPPQDILDSLLAKSNHAKKDSGKTQADQALQVTSDALKAMRGSGMIEDDELLKLMVAREAQQAKEARSQSDKQPSKKSRMLTLEAIKSDFAKATGEQADGRATGATKAAERAAARSKTADELIEMAKLLKGMVTDSATRLNEAHHARAQQKEQQAAAVMGLMEEKLVALHSEPAEDVLIPDEDEDAPATATENELDEAKRLTTLLTLQLQQLQSATAAAQAQAAENQAAPAAAAAPAAPTAEWWDDLHLQFEAEAAQLPALQGAATGTQKDAIDILKAPFHAIPWGGALPSVQFEQLGVQPCFVHGLVGDTIWHACWGDRHQGITLQHAVPYKLLNVVRHVVEGITAVQTEAQLNDGKTRFLAAQTEAEKRKAEKRGPY